MFRLRKRKPPPQKKSELELLKARHKEAVDSAIRQASNNDRLEALHDLMLETLLRQNNAEGNSE